jgi:hypothetical protein
VKIVAVVDAVLGSDGVDEQTGQADDEDWCLHPTVLDFFS